MSKKRPLAHPIGSRRTRIGICVLLVAVTWLVFGQTLWHGFINYDDPVYVYENPVVKSGLTLHGIGWAFTHSHGFNWHPLTWISHMLDCQFYGLKAGGHHFTNVLLHTIAVLLLFVLLWQMTGALWRSGFVATVFAIHPSHVESVAWIAERKDVLSGVFFMLTLIAYVRYARDPSLGRYVTMLVLFACGLMAKPMLVTIPLILLLLDYWPLGRFAQSLPRESKAVRWRLVLEKVPLLVLSFASCIATFIAQQGAMNSFEQLPLALRINNALVSCLTYIRQMIWPVNLTVYYPHPSYQLPFWEIALAAALLVTITIVAAALPRKYPYLITGWLWYLVMLVPVIGVIQVGSQAHADRYTYLPQIGLCFAITWVVTDLSRSWPRRREILGAGAIMAIAALALSAWHQTSFWRESESLWTRALAVNSNNDVAHSHLGNSALQKGRIDEAILHYQKALEISQNYKETDRREAYYNLGYALLRKDKIDEAIANYRKALEGPFQYEPEAHSSLGDALLRKGQIDEAIVHFEKFVQLRPDHAEAYYNLGNALLQKGRMDDAVAHFEKALKLNPVLAEAENDLGNALFRKGKVEEAIAHYERALQIDPRSISALSQLAWVLATNSEAQIRNGAKAIELAREADQFSGGQNPMILHTLAAAYAETGQFSQAVETAQDALKLAISESNTALAEALRQVIGLYQAGKPYHQPRE
ncbi:MAG TPA: tetratricopeptide repeat protein [Pyrinomonadaceae bacterium]|nr:tetratricopeptide repeat protein [Pyrinomonadaceae bacterium]